MTTLFTYVTSGVRGVYMKFATLADIEQGRDNNLNLIRMIAATGVLISHAWPVSTGVIEDQPFATLLNGIDLGMISVYIFFAISGYLIAQSYDRDPKLTHFWTARALRIFPALLVVLLITALVLAPIITVATVDAVLKEAPEYILRNFTLFSLDQFLPGVFKGNPVGGAINIPLWTLSHELLCYFLVTLLGLAGILKHPRLMLLVWILFVLVYAMTLYLEPEKRLVALAKLAFPFMIGALFFVWRKRLPMSWWIGIALALIALAAHGSVVFREIFVFTLVYWVFLFGYLPTGSVRAYNRLGDYSYGIYIYAFPIQQLIVFSGVTTPMMNILLAFPLALACAVLSWTFVENPALALARRLRAPRRANI